MWIIRRQRQRQIQIQRQIWRWRWRLIWDHSCNRRKYDKDNVNGRRENFNVYYEDEFHGGEVHGDVGGDFCYDCGKIYNPASVSRLLTLGGGSKRVGMA